MTNREIDRIIAEKVMGLKIKEVSKGHYLVNMGSFDTSIPHYCTNIYYAREVLEKIVRDLDDSN